MSKQAPFIGIDFGTSKSAVTWYNPDTKQAEIIRNAYGEEETPSVVYLADNPSETLIGTPAKRKLEDEQVENHRFILSIKRNLLSAPTKVVGGKLYTPVDVAATILRRLREDAESQHFHQPVENVVVTYPASFEALQQDKIKQAALLAGFTQVTLLAEPVAAAIAYGHQGLQVGNYVLVYDFGGGTFDIALLNRVRDGSFMQVLPSRGLNDCAGDDIDRELYSYCDEIALQTLGRHISLSKMVDWSFLLLCRARKENLSSMQEATFSTYLQENGNVFRFKHTLTRPTFEKRIEKYVQRTVTLTKDMLQDAKESKANVDTLVLIGGSSRIPLASRLLKETLPLEPRAWQKSDFAVALGAAYHAHELWGEKAASSTTSTSSQSSQSTPPLSYPGLTSSQSSKPTQSQSSTASTSSKPSQSTPPLSYPGLTSSQSSKSVQLQSSTTSASSQSSRQVQSQSPKSSSSSSSRPAQKTTSSGGSTGWRWALGILGVFLFIGGISNSSWLWVLGIGLFALACWDSVWS